MTSALHLEEARWGPQGRLWHKDSHGSYLLSTQPEKTGSKIIRHFSCLLPYPCQVHPPLPLLPGHHHKTLPGSPNSPPELAEVQLEHILNKSPHLAWRSGAGRYTSYRDNSRPEPLKVSTLLYIGSLRPSNLESISSADDVSTIQLYFGWRKGWVWIKIWKKRLTDYYAPQHIDHLPP